MLRITPIGVPDGDHIVVASMRPQRDAADNAGKLTNHLLEISLQ